VREIKVPLIRPAPKQMGSHLRPETAFCIGGRGKPPRGAVAEGFRVPMMAGLTLPAGERWHTPIHRGPFSPDRRRPATTRRPRGPLHQDRARSRPAGPAPRTGVRSPVPASRQRADPGSSGRCFSTVSGLIFARRPSVAVSSAPASSPASNGLQGKRPSPRDVSLGLGLFQEEMDSLEVPAGIPCVQPDLGEGGDPLSAGRNSGK
jgi:hypothetical protein